MSADSAPQEPAEPTPAAETRQEPRCNRCRKAPPADGLKACRPCLDAHAARRKSRRKAVKAKRGPKPKPPKPAAPIATKPTEPAKPVTVASVFEPFAAQLKAIDWRDPVKREAEVGAILGQMLVAVVVAPQLSDADREKLQWLQSLSRQMVTFRDASAIEAARRKLSGEDEETPEDVDGPQLEPTIEVVDRESSDSESDSGRSKQTFRGRPRARAFS